MLCWRRWRWEFRWSPRRSPAIAGSSATSSMAGWRRRSDHQALARVILDQWDNFDRAFHMSRAARSRVREEFSITAVARKHLALFRGDPGTDGGNDPVLNVLQLIPTLDRSGAEKQMVLLAKGLPRDRFHVEVAALTRLGPLQADLEAAGVPVTAHRQAVQARSPGAVAAGPVPQVGAIRRRADLDLRGQHLRAGRGPPARRADRDHHRDGRRSLEGQGRAVRRPPAGPLVRPAGGQLARRRRLLSIAGRARGSAGDDLLGDRRGEEPPQIDPASRFAPSSASRPTRRWFSSPAVWPSRSESTTCSRRSTCSSTCSPNFAR